MNDSAPLSDMYAADLLDVVASTTPASWPPRVAARPSKRRKRKLALAEFPVEIEQLPRIIVRVRGGHCPACSQPIEYGSSAVAVKRTLMHPRCAPQTSRTTTQQIGRSA